MSIKVRLGTRWEAGPLDSTFVLFRHFVAKDAIKLILLSLSPEYCDYKHELLCAALDFGHFYSLSC